MFLRAKIDYTDFIRTVQTCKGSVLFITRNGDRLDLKSQLCKYLFVTAAFKTDLLNDGHVICSEETDYDSLSDYLEAKDGAC